MLKREFEPVSIQTERLQLRFLTEGDVPALFALFSDAEVTRYWNWPAWNDLSQARQYLQDAQDDYRSGSAIRLGIERRADRLFIGTVNLHHFHYTSRRAEIGYALLPPYWGAGYMQEALHAMLHYAFQDLDLNRVEADIDPRNLASAKTLERLGFQKEGHLRESWIVNGVASDSWLYGLLRREWLASSHKA